MSTQFKLRIIKKIENAQMQKYFLEVKNFSFSLIRKGFCWLKGK
jgi:hypothetical protein